MIKPKRILTVLLIGLISINLLFSNIKEVKALTIICPPVNNIFIAAYNQDTFVEGLAIKYETTGKGCDVLPAMSESNESLNTIFLTSSQELNQSLSTGVYQLSVKCEVWSGQCSESALEKLSDNPAEFGKYKSQWQLKVKEAPRNLAKEKWTRTMAEVAVKSVTLGIILTTIFWPWVLLRLKNNIKRVWLLLILAIVMQFIVRFMLSVVFSYDMYVYNSAWGRTVSISQLALVISIIIEIVCLIYLIYKMFKTKKAAVSSIPHQSSFDGSLNNEQKEKVSSP